jgi:signal transduction histidine kinase
MIKLKIIPIAMNLTLQLRSSPLRLLFLLEWVLLGVAAIAQLLAALVKPGLGLPLVNGVGLIIFAGMGLISPRRLIDKLLYTVSEFALLILLSFRGESTLPSLLYVVLVIRNCVLLAGQDPPQGRLRSMITVLAFAICLLSQTYRLWYGRLALEVPLDRIGLVWIGFSITFGLVFLFLQLLVDAVLSERKGQEQLAKANAQLRQYALRVEELATEQERNRIARDIHDSLGHSLTVFNIHIAAALRLLHSDPTEAEALLLEVKQLGTQALQEVRQSVAVLRADPFQGRSLVEAIANLVTEFQRATGITPTYTIEIDKPLSGELNFTLYRLVQESLTNICKHATATEVAIAIQQTSTELQAIVKDNGKGFDLHHNPSGFGLQGMQERTLALAGELKIKTAPGQGCHIHAIFPSRSL